MDKRKEFVSVGITFVAAFLIAIGSELATNGGIDLTSGALFAILMAGVRAGVKAVSSLFIRV